jgi:hypothetical protein
MRLAQWMMLIGIVTGLGCLQVAQRNALFLKGYAVGERVQRVHAKETDVSWLNARIVEMTSPVRLADIAQERRLKLVARAMMPSGQGGVVPASETRSAAGGVQTIQVAADDTAD